MNSDAHSELLARATVAIEGIDRTLARQEAAFEGQQAAFERQQAAFERQQAASERQERSLANLFRRMDERDAVARERHELLLEEHRRLHDRSARSEDRVVEVLNEIHSEVGRNTSRIDDMGAAIRANTQAVLAMLDRLGPAPG